MKPIEQLPIAEKDAPPASSWNYRVTRTKVDGEDVYEIREVYYTYGQPHSWSRDPIAPHGESWHELADDLVKMQRAVAEPILDLTGDKPREMTGAERARTRVTPPGGCSHVYPDGTRCTLTDHSAPGLAEVHGLDG